MTTTELKKLMPVNKADIQGHGIVEFYTPEQVVEILGLLGVSRSFSDWIKEVAKIDKEQEFLLEMEEIFEWQEWYQKGMTPEDAIKLNYHNYG